ncbi:MAG: lipid-binding SYLF domain-containing protein [Marivibrio sp.]|uniref:lipid-binding SYLF domain-containing protein n=1 Tax=Marivibrio sp. TaxID=2039719 RepID=UPI0032EB7CB3
MPLLKTRLAVVIAALMLAAAVLAAPPAKADQADAEELVTEAQFTLKKLQKHPDLGPYVKAYLKRAKAVLIVPQLLKGGFIVGGEGGTGVLLARDEQGRWSYPAFYSMGAASFGLQFGGQASEVLLLVMTGSGLQAILEDMVKIGGELDGAAGPYGAGLDASTTTNLNVDILSYSVAQGLYIGVNFEGSVILPRDSLNEAYYGRRLAPEAIVLQGQAGNPHADLLRDALADATR